MMHIAISKSLYGYQRRYFEYITCKKALLCCYEKNRQLLVKKKIRQSVFPVGQFLAATAEETTKKAQISYQSFPRLVKLFIENYPGQKVICSFCIYKINQIFRYFMTCLVSKYERLILHEMIKQITDLHPPTTAIKINFA